MCTYIHVYVICVYMGKSGKCAFLTVVVTEPLHTVHELYRMPVVGGSCDTGCDFSFEELVGCVYNDSGHRGSR